MRKLSKKTRKTIAFVIEEVIAGAIVVAALGFILSINGMVENGVSPEAVAAFLASIGFLYTTRKLYTIANK